MQRMTLAARALLRRGRRCSQGHGRSFDGRRPAALDGAMDPFPAAADHLPGGIGTLSA